MWQPPTTPADPRAPIAILSPSGTPSPGTPNPARRAKIVELAPLRAHVRGSAGPGQVVLDLQTPLDALRSIKSDLEAYYWERPADDDIGRMERFQLQFWIRELADRTASLESVLLHMGTPMIVVDGLTTGEAEAVLIAAGLRERGVYDGDGFAAVRTKVEAMLRAATTLGLKLAAGRPRS